MRLRTISLMGILTLLVAFILCKLPFIGTPFYWDEGWVYGPAVLEMSDNCPSLMPNSIPVYLGRGHPLLFHFTASVWSKLFGANIYSLHVFTVLMSTAFLASVCIVIRNLLSKLWVMALVFLIAVQPVILAQSGLVLPELMMAGLVFIALLSYLQDRAFIFMICMSMAVLTKESAIVIIFAFFVGEIKRNKFQLRDWMNRWWVAVPIVPFVIFLLVQKSQLGWYFYSHHVGYITPNFGDIIDKILYACYFVFIRQGRFIITIIVVLLLVLKIAQKDGKQLMSHVYITCFSVLFIFIGSASISFLLDRYLILPVLVLIFFAVKLIVDAQLLSKVKYVVVGLIAIVGIGFNFEKYYDPEIIMNDCDLSYVEIANAQRDFIQKHEDSLQNCTVHVPFVLESLVKDSRLGYVSEGQELDKATNDPAASWYYTITSNHDISSASQLQLSNFHYIEVDSIVVGNFQMKLIKKNHTDLRWWAILDSNQ